MKNMIIVGALMLGSMTVAAQGRSKPQSASPQRVNQSQSLDKKLNLTNGQEVKVNEIRRETKTKVNAIRDDKNLSEADKRAKLRTVVKEGQLKKEEVLTPRQQKIRSSEMKNRR